MYYVMDRQMRGQSDNSTTLVATRLNMTQHKNKMYKSIWSSLCIDASQALFPVLEFGLREVSVNTLSLYRVHSGFPYLCEYPRILR